MTESGDRPMNHLLLRETTWRVIASVMQIRRRRMRENRTLWQFLMGSAVPEPCGGAIPDLANYSRLHNKYACPDPFRRVRCTYLLKVMASVLRSECWLRGHVRRGQQRNVATNQSLLIVASSISRNPNFMTRMLTWAAPVCLLMCHDDIGCLNANRHQRDTARS